MATLKDLNLKIGSLGNTKKVTLAMKMIAASKLSKTQSNMVKSNQYLKELSAVFNSFFTEENSSNHPLLKKKDKVKKIKIILLTSNRGLCGGFNANVIKKAIEFFNDKKKFAEQNDIELEVDFFGKKGSDTLSKHFPTGKIDSDSIKEINYEATRKSIQKYIKDFQNDEIDEVYVLYNEFKNVLSQEPTVKRILPFQVEKTEDNKNEVDNFLLEPDRETLEGDLVESMLYFQFYSFFLHSIVGENAARMAAMDQSSKNANDLIDKYTLERNRVRQASITTELLEIIAGAESLK